MLYYFIPKICFDLSLNVWRTEKDEGKNKKQFPSTSSLSNLGAAYLQR